MSIWIKEKIYEPKSCDVCLEKFVRGETIRLMRGNRKGVHPECYYHKNTPLYFREDEWGKKFLCINRKFVK